MLSLERRPNRAVQTLRTIQRQREPLDAAASSCPSFRPSLHHTSVPEGGSGRVGFYPSAVHETDSFLAEYSTNSMCAFQYRAVMPACLTSGAELTKARVSRPNSAVEDKFQVEIGQIDSLC